MDKTEKKKTIGFDVLLSICSPAISVVASAVVILTFGMMPASADLWGYDPEFHSNVSGEYRHFFDSSDYPNQSNDQWSWRVESEIYNEWNQGRDTLTISLFGRYDYQDDERAHADVRELMWVHVADSWETHVGIGKVFWGTTESQHIVDVVNQTDLVESVDGEEKLGQPMFRLSVPRAWGSVDVFVLPYFRERSFPSPESRLGFNVKVDHGNAEYESGKEKNHIDYAARVNFYIQEWDVALSVFDGTNREPLLTSTVAGFTPYYVQMTQWGLDIQGATGNTVWKLEAAYRDTTPQHYVAATVGLEHTLVGFYNAKDLGLLLEYQYDERDEEATTYGQNDVFLGARVAFNDIAGTELLLGVSQDLQNAQSRVGYFEVASRINEAWHWAVEGWLFQSDDGDDAHYHLRGSDFVQFNLTYYF